MTPMNDEPDEFGIKAAASLKEVGAPDLASVDLERRSITDLPDRSRPRTLGFFRRGRIVGLAAVVPVLAIVAALALWVPAQLNHAPAGLDPSRFAGDPRMLACEKYGDRTLSDVQYAFELAHGRDYRANLRLPVQPDLAGAEEPALVVVFTTGTPLHSIGGDPPVAFTPRPGARTVCVDMAGLQYPLLLNNLDPSEIVLPPAPQPTGPIAGVFADTKRVLAAMAWDAGSKSLWVVDSFAGWSGLLTRVGLDGSTQHWALPNGPHVQLQPAIKAGAEQPAGLTASYDWNATDVVVDGQGKVWIAAGYGLVRFDPATGKSQLKVFAELEMSKVYAPGGRWLSAISADGDGVLVTRDGDPAVYRVDESLSVTTLFTLPSRWIGLAGIAVVGDRILVGDDNVDAAFDRNGKQIAQGTSTVTYGSLRTISANRAVILPTAIGDTEATVIDQNCAAVGRITIPMEPIQAGDTYNRLVLATDWISHVWYGEWDETWPVYLVQAELSPMP
jgi:hypothetical protein